MPPRPAPPRRSCCSRCSGRARRPARPRPRRASAARSCAQQLLRPPSACRACRCRTAPRRGRGTTSAGPPACRRRRPGPRRSRPCGPRPGPSATRQAQTCSPSSSTVQAPQSPASQPTLVPVRPRSSRSAAARRVTGGPSQATGLAVQGEVDRSSARSSPAARRSSVDDRVAPIVGAAAHVVDRRERRELRGIDPVGQPIARRADQRGLERRQALGDRRAGADRDAGRGDATLGELRAVAAAMAIEITR